MLFSLSAAGRRSYQFKIMMLFSLESYQFKNHNNKLNMVLSSQKKIKYADETYFCMCMNMSIVVVYHYVTRVYFKDSNFQLMIIYLILQFSQLLNNCVQRYFKKYLYRSIASMNYSANVCFIYLSRLIIVRWCIYKKSDVYRLKLFFNKKINAHQELYSCIAFSYCSVVKLTPIVTKVDAKYQHIQTYINIWSKTSYRVAQKEFGGRIFKI